MTKKVIGCIIAISVGSMFLFTAIVGYLIFVADKQPPDFEAVLQVPPPSADQIPLYEPQFNGQFGSVRAGTAFLTSAPGGDEVMILTAAHLLGEAGGLDRDLSGEELIRDFNTLICHPILEHGETLTTTQMLPITSARSMDWNTSAYDLLAFAVSGETPPPIVMAADAPAPGEPVWLYAQTLTDDHPKLYLGLVVLSSSNWLEYAFHNRNIILTATSGAPVLNRHGQLVGVNLGGYSENQTTYGISIPIYAIKQRITESRSP